MRNNVIRMGLCIVGAIVLTLLAYLNKRDGTFQSLYAWVWLGLALVGLFLATKSLVLASGFRPRTNFFS